VVAILQPLKNHKPIPIDRAVVLVGRGSECDVVINGSKKISRKHCCLVQSDQSFFIRDLGSTNGVWVNGKRVDCISDMSDGDRVAIGDVQFQFYPNGFKKSSGIQVLDQDAPSAVTPRSKLAGSGIDILRSQPSSAEQNSVEDVEMIEIVDDDFLGDGLIEIKDDDLIDDNDFEEVDDLESIPSRTPLPQSPKRKPSHRKPSHREVRSEPVINLDDSFADEEIEDIIDFND
jgi:predicted component of type VI protein secretion system